MGHLLRLPLHRTRYKSDGLDAYAHKSIQDRHLDEVPAKRITMKDNTTDSLQRRGWTNERMEMGYKWLTTYERGKQVLAEYKHIHRHDGGLWIVLIAYR